MSFRFRVLLAAGALALPALLAPSDACAWGSEGHRIVADIAELNLDPETAHRVRDLLAIDNATTLAQVSTWADEIRPQRRETGPWHYVNIPVDPPPGTPTNYDRARDCPADACVVVKLGEFVQRLRDRSLDRRQRLEALKFVVHFAGDITQPLHCADNHDRGGNDIHVRFDGRATNLHAVWDTAILTPAVNGDERRFALELWATVVPDRATLWLKGGAADWANESYDLARRAIYSPPPHDGEELPAAYASRMLPLVEGQVERAGVRLAALLNSAFR